MWNPQSKVAGRQQKEGWKLFVSSCCRLALKWQKAAKIICMHGFPNAARRRMDSKGVQGKLGIRMARGPLLNLPSIASIYNQLGFVS